MGAEASCAGFSKSDHWKSDATARPRKTPVSVEARGPQRSVVRPIGTETVARENAEVLRCAEAFVAFFCRALFTASPTQQL